MQRKSLKKISVTVAYVAGILISQFGFAAGLTIDDFTHYQRATDFGDSIGPTSNKVFTLTGTDLINASRTFIAKATTDDEVSETDIKATKGLLKIANSVTSSGNASIEWNFDPINFTQFGNAILLEVVDIDLNVNVEMVVNGIASSGIKTFSGVDNFLVNFNDFSNSGVFSNVSSFRLNFSGPLAWDGQFRLLTTTTPVPLPPAFLLMGSILVGFIGISRRKSII